MYKAKWREVVLKNKRGLSNITACCFHARFLFTEDSHLAKTKRLVCSFDPLFCVHWEALWCQLLSQREKLNSCHKQKVTVWSSRSQSAEHYFSIKFHAIFVCLSEMSRGGEKGIRAEVEGLEQEPDSKWHENKVCALAWGATKGPVCWVF